MRLALCARARQVHMPIGPIGRMGRMGQNGGYRLFPGSRTLASHQSPLTFHFSLLTSAGFPCI
jgi:hypothetical protein